MKGLKWITSAVLAVLLAFVIGLLIGAYTGTSLFYGRFVPLSDEAQVATYFSPKGGATGAIVTEIDRAQQQILVQAYSFTSAPIAKALVAAHRRDVSVTVILDRSHLTGQYSEADFLNHAGVRTYIDDKHAIAHNKVMLIDGETVITGSFNFTRQAERSNAENVLILKRTPEVYRAYEKNFWNHFEHTKKYQPQLEERRSTVKSKRRSAAKSRAKRVPQYQ